MKKFLVSIFSPFWKINGSDFFTYFFLSVFLLIPSGILVIFHVDLSLRWPAFIFFTFLIFYIIFNISFKRNRDIWNWIVLSIFLSLFFIWLLFTWVFWVFYLVYLVNTKSAEPNKIEKDNSLFKKQICKEFSVIEKLELNKNNELKFWIYEKIKNNKNILDSRDMIFIKNHIRKMHNIFLNNADKRLFLDKNYFTEYFADLLSIFSWDSEIIKIIIYYINNTEKNNLYFSFRSLIDIWYDLKKIYKSNPSILNKIPVRTAIHDNLIDRFLVDLDWIPEIIKSIYYSEQSSMASWLRSPLEFWDLPDKIELESLIFIKEDEELLDDCSNAVFLKWNTISDLLKTWPKKNKNFYLKWYILPNNYNIVFDTDRFFLTDKKFNRLNYSINFLWKYFYYKDDPWWMVWISWDYNIFSHFNKLDSMSTEEHLKSFI